MENKDLRLSVSKCKTFKDCKKKFEFTYIHKLPRKTYEYHTLGSFCHKVLEEFHKFYLAGDTDPFHVVMKKAWLLAVEEFKEVLTPEIKKEARAMINQYLIIVTENKANNVDSTITHCEKNFSLPIETENIQVILNGFIDVIQVDRDGVIHVADYKTTKNKKYLVNDFFQLLTYAYVLLQENPSLEKIRASYILLRHNYEYVTKEFAPKEIMKVRDEYIDYAHKIMNEKEYKANITPLCGYCDHSEICTDYQRDLKAKELKRIKFGEVKW